MKKLKREIVTDIAKTLGTSSSSVYRALTDMPGVRPDIRSQVKALAMAVGYRPTAPAKTRHEQKNEIVALFVGDVRNPYFADLTYCLQSELTEQGFTVMLFNPEFEESKEIHFLRMAHRYHWSGVISMSAIQNDRLLHELERLDCPTVLLNRSIDGFKGSTVIIDNFQAGYRITKHLIELGHQRIAFLAGPANSNTSAQRLQGFKQALANYSISFDERDLFQGDLKMETGFSVARTYIKDIASRPSAIICGNDLMAIGFLQVCKENGLRVPEDLSIAGFDDIPNASLTGIDLTTVRQPTQVMGHKAVELLLRQIRKQSTGPEKVILDPELIIRKTTAPPPIK